MGPRFERIEGGKDDDDEDLESMYSRCSTTRNGEGEGGESERDEPAEDDHN